MSNNVLWAINSGIILEVVMNYETNGDKHKTHSHDFADVIITELMNH